MDGILDIIASKTHGKSHKSYKLCHDTLSAVPQVAYEDDAGRISLKEYAETAPSEKFVDLTKRSHDLFDKSIPPLFRFFLDGSRRTYKIDDIEYGKKIYPVIAGQIGVGCCERVDRSLKKAKIEKHTVIVLPEYAHADGHNPSLYFRRITDELNQMDVLKNRGLSVSKVLHYDCSKADGDKFEKRGIAKIQDAMIDYEKSMVNQLVRKGKLSQDSCLLKDGSIQYIDSKEGDFKVLSKIRANYQYVVGVSKSFNPELMLDSQKKSNATKIAQLPLFHRTPAFMYENERFQGIKFAIWYLRIRDVKRTETPFSGVVKVEKMLMVGNESEKGLQSDEIDLISANLINERNPVCYGSDTRWANHLYPVYLTEKFIKSQYLSDVYFLNLF
jgi:hypothetical protein